MVNTIEEAESVRTDPGGWVRVGRIGAGGFVLWAVGLQLGSGILDPLLTAFAFIYLGFARWLRRSGRRGIIAFISFASLTMAINIVFGSSEFAYPESVGSFVPQLFVTLALALSLLGGIGSLAGWDAGRTRPLVTGAAAVLALGLTMSLIASAAAPSDSALDDDFVIDARAFEWEPDVVVFDPGEFGGLWIENHDLAHHTLVVAELGLEVDLPSSKARRVDVIRPAPGEYDILCTVPGHESMTGTLVVTD